MSEKETTVAVGGSDEEMAARGHMVLAMVLARLEARGQHLADLSPEEIAYEIDSAAADLKLAEDCTHGR